jgi:ubiquinone/menaquinone biosynthesis C-methylase UbiE
MKEYYDRRAREYDATTYKLVLQDDDASRDLGALEALLTALPPATTLDIGCGTGWLTRFLPGAVVALDQSESMLRIARRRVPGAVFVLADVPPLPFPAGSFDRALASHVYSHVETADERQAFVDEAFRVAGELIVVEQADQRDRPKVCRELRTLEDGTEHRVFKRYLTAVELADELGGEILLDTPTLVAVRTRAEPDSGGARTTLP